MSVAPGRPKRGSPPRAPQETVRLRRTANAQRQEEIAEQIEALLLSGAALQD